MGYAFSRDFTFWVKFARFAIFGWEVCQKVEELDFWVTFRFSENCHVGFGVSGVDLEFESEKNRGIGAG